MHFGLLVLAGLLLAVSNTYEISQRSGRIRAAHDEGIRHLIENEGVQYRFALPDMTGSDEREEPKRMKLETLTISAYTVHATRHLLQVEGRLCQNLLKVLSVQLYCLSLFSFALS